MNDTNLMAKAEVIQSLIDASRKRIRNGEQVDLGMIEAKVAALHKSVSNDPEARQRAATTTVAAMEEILAGLDDVAREIQAGSQAMSQTRAAAGISYFEGK
ncbi:MAG: hypothetical protein VYE18_05990 [Pseudomonadota bacterium]|nr:hypothetical protein [Pseudomonadota bacterium]